MLVQKYKDMLSGKSVIRELSEFATARGQEIGYENVFDYSLGNPSVPAPREFTDEMIRMLKQMGTNELHGYSPSLGIPGVREAVAMSLEKRFGLPYRKEHIFMAVGAAGALAHAFRLVTEPGDEILTFSGIRPLCESDRGGAEGGAAGYGKLSDSFCKIRGNAHGKGDGGADQHPEQPLGGSIFCGNFGEDGRFAAEEISGIRAYYLSDIR